MLRKQAKRPSVQPDADELPNEFLLSQVAESGAYMVSTRREFLALEIAAQLSRTVGADVEVQTLVPLKSDHTKGMPTFSVHAPCSFDEMHNAIQCALFECIQFDAALIQLNLLEAQQ